jgi:hypothetical protein
MVGSLEGLAHEEEQDYVGDHELQFDASVVDGNGFVQSDLGDAN